MNRQSLLTCGATKEVRWHDPYGAYWEGMGKGWLEIWRCCECGSLRAWGCSLDKPDGFEICDTCPMEPFWLPPFGEQNITITRESLGLPPATWRGKEGL